MIGLRMGLGAAALLLSAHIAVAQQPTTRPQGRATGDTAMMGQHMRSMDSVNTRLDSLVTQMNAASGDQKMNAMAEILTTLVSERRMMMQHMGQMRLKSLQLWLGGLDRSDAATFFGDIERGIFRRKRSHVNNGGQLTRLISK